MTDPQTNLVLEALVLTWPEGMSIDPLTGRGSCVETTLVLDKVLTVFGIEHKPWPCQVWVANRQGKELADSGVTIDQWPPEAFSIGVDPDTHAMQRTTAEPYALGRFSGHLAVAGRDWLLDLTVQQFARPQKGVVIDGAILITDVPIDLLDEARQMIEGDLRGGGVIRYISRLELASWRTTPAWRQDVPRGLIDAICEGVIEKIKDR